MDQPPPPLAPVRPRTKQQRLRAKQIGGMPDYQTPALYPAQLGEGIKWMNLVPDEDHPMGVIVGLLVTQSGWICYAPVPTPRMKIDRFLVTVEHISMDGDAQHAMTLLYLDKEHQFHKLASTPQVANGDRFRYEIPLERLDRNASFRCSLHVQLMDESKPVIITGLWAEAEGL